MKTMKKVLTFMAVLALLLTSVNFVGAQAPLITTDSSALITQTTAKSYGSCNLNGNSQCKVWFQYGTSIINLNSLSSSTILTTNSIFSANLSGLNSNTTYYYRAVGADSSLIDTAYGVIKSFTTLTVLLPPSCTTIAANAISQTGGILNGTFNPNGSNGYTHFEWGTTILLGTLTTIINQGLNPGTMSHPLTGLTANTTYYFKAVCQNSDSTVSGSVLSFTTTANPTPTVVTTSAGPIGLNTATLNGTVNPNGGYTIARFEYGLTTSYGSTTTNYVVGSGFNSVPVGISVSGLTANTVYNYRIVAEDVLGNVYYGQNESFITTSYVPACVVTSPVSGITTTTATLNGLVNPNGTNANAWFLWGTATPISVVGIQTVGGGNSNVPVNYVLTGLNPGTTYYIELIGQNSGGTTPGGIVSFTTLGGTTNTSVTIFSASVTSDQTADVYFYYNSNDPGAVWWLKYCIGNSIIPSFAQSTVPFPQGQGVNLMLNGGLLNLSGGLTYSVCVLAMDGNMVTVSSDTITFSTPLAISEIGSGKSSIEIFPNPIVNEAVINSSTDGIMSVLDITGKQVKVMNITKGKSIFVKGELNPGIYIFTFRGEDSEISTGKFIVQ
jgi:hypothetical protein